MQLSSHNHYKFTVHGHTPMKRPLINDHVAYIDTGAVFGGVLTALYIPDIDNPTVGRETISVDGDNNVRTAAVV